MTSRTVTKNVTPNGINSHETLEIKPGLNQVHSKVNNLANNAFDECMMNYSSQDLRGPVNDTGFLRTVTKSTEKVVHMHKKTNRNYSIEY